MRNRKTLIHFFSALMIVLLVLISVSVLIIKPNKLKRLYNIVEKYSTAESELDVSFSEINRNFLNHIEITDLKIRISGEEVFYASDFFVSSGLGSLIKGIIKSEQMNLNLRLDDVNFRFSQVLYDYLFTQKKESFSVIETLKNFSLNLSVNDLSFYADFNGNTIKTSDKIGIQAVLKNNLTLNSIKCNIPQLDGYIKSLNTNVAVSDIEVASDYRHNINFRVGELVLTDLIHAELFNADFSLTNGLVKGTGSLDSAGISYMEIPGTVNKMNFSYNINLNRDSENYEFSSDIQKGSAVYKGKSFSFDSVSASVSFLPGTGEKQFFVSSHSVGIYETYEYKIDELSLSDLFLSLASSDNLASEFELQTFFNGKCQIKGIDNFSGQLNFDTQLKSLKDLKNLDNYINSDFEIRGLQLSDLKNSFISIEKYDSEHLNLSANLGNELILNSSFDFKNKTTNLRSYFTDFKINRYVSMIENIISDKYRKNFDDITKLNGSFIYNGSVSSDDKSGRLSLNLIANDLILAKTRRTLAASIEAVSTGSIIEFNSLALTGFDKRLSYSGSLDFNNFFPQGRLLLQNAGSGKELCSVSFALDSDNKGYILSGSIPDKPEFGLNGHVNWDSSANIQTAVDIKTQNGYYDFSAYYDNCTKSIVMNSGKSNVQISLSDSVIDTEVMLNDFSLYFDNNVNLIADAYLKGVIDSSSRKFDFSCRNFDIVVSDILSFGFSFDFTQNTFDFKNLHIDSNDVSTDYIGIAHFEYKSLPEILSGNTESLFCDVNLFKQNRTDFIKAYAENNEYSFSMINSGNLNYSLNLLGNDSIGFFADCRFEELFFEARYKERKLDFYKASGKIGIFNIDDFFLDIDFINRSLSSKAVFKTVRHHLDKDVEQGGTVELNAKLDILVLGALSLAGIDVDAEFNLHLRDFYIGNEISLINTDVDLILSRDNLNFNSDMIKGSFNITENFLNIDVDPAFLIGFHAEGYLDDNIDLMVSDIFIPANLLDQFISTPIMSTKDGIIEGSVLVIGPSSDPSMYGTLFIQSFDLGLFYLPNQTLSIRNMILSIHEHDVSSRQVQIIGNSSSDGRFYRAYMDLDLKLNSLSVNDLNVNIDVYENSLDLWIPIKGNPSVNIRGNTSGFINVWYRNNELGIDTEIEVSDADVSFTLDEVPEWFEYVNLYCTADVDLTIGNNVVFYYPSKQNPFMNFTIQEGEKLNFNHSMITNNNTGEGTLQIKTGRFSYIHNDFSVTEGQLILSKPVLGQAGLDFAIDLTAKLREYDANGKRVDIYLILNNATFSDLNPGFESVPYYTEKEILSILGQSILPGENQNVSFSGIANAAAIATDTITSLGIVNTNRNYSINSVIKDSLNLDVLSFRSPLVQNIIINAIPGYETSSNLLAKYLNGTTLYAGKYINDSIFAKMTLLLKDSGHKGRNLNYGHFLTDDLNLDIEFSCDWDNPLGNFSLFMQPQELSVLNFLDTIGFSYSKRFKL